MRLRHRYLAYIDRHPDSRKVFIIGTGRSGTHWIGQILESHPAISATLEKSAIFDRVVRMATDPSNATRLLPGLIRRYRWEHCKVAPLNYVDKSHPNIWLVEELSHAFPQARFVGIRRNPYATVSSMLRHAGVRRWCEEWHKLPAPNSFLGIDEGKEDWYASLSLSARCAARWLSHSRRMDHLALEYPSAVTIIEYEELFGAPATVLIELQRFLGLDDPFPPPVIKNASMTKWEAGLSQRDIQDVKQVTGIDPPSKHRTG